MSAGEKCAVSAGCEVIFTGCVVKPIVRIIVGVCGDRVGTVFGADHADGICAICEQSKGEIAGEVFGAHVWHGLDYLPRGPGGSKYYLVTECASSAVASAHRTASLHLRTQAQK